MNLHPEIAEAIIKQIKPWAELAAGAAMVLVVLFLISLILSLLYTLWRDVK